MKANKISGYCKNSVVPVFQIIPTPVVTAWPVISNINQTNVRLTTIGPSNLNLFSDWLKLNLLFLHKLTVIMSYDYHLIMLI